VKIRTMRGDIAMMASSGGGMPRFENVHIAGLAVQQKESKQEAVASAARAGSKSDLALIVVLVVMIAALAAVGWLVYLKFQG
jgi:uncharacterized membrane protein